MKAIWCLTINTGYDWETKEEKFFSKKEYAKEYASKHGEDDFHIDKIKLEK